MPLEYACGAWGGLSKHDSERLDRVQRSAARLITRVSIADRIPHALLLACAGLDDLDCRRNVILAGPIFRLCKPEPSGRPYLPTAFDQWQEMAPPSSSAMRLRYAGSDYLRLPRPRTEVLRRSPFYRVVSLLNSLLAAV